MGNKINAFFFKHKQNSTNAHPPLFVANPAVCNMFEAISCFFFFSMFTLFTIIFIYKGTTYRKVLAVCAAICSDAIIAAQSAN